MREAFLIESGIAAGDIRVMWQIERSTSPSAALSARVPVAHRLLHELHDVLPNSGNLMSWSKLFSSWIALGLIVSLTATTTLGCGRAEAPPPVDDLQRALQAAPERTGMSTGKKVVLLAGAAALYYLYKKHQNAQSSETGPESQYYLSKNGRVYYRDAEHRAHWVTPPPGGITVPADQAHEFREFQGYENNSTGRDLRGLGADAE